MLIQIIFSIIIGTFLGTLTGLIPGIHINLVASLMISTFILPINTIYIITIITSLSITHTFIDFIPSIFIGSPDTDTELAILPGHKLLKKGQAYQAITLTTYGSLTAIIILILISLPSFLLIKNFYNTIKSLIPYILIIISIILISTERKKLTALKIFLLTGFLGYSITNPQINQPLLPLLTGLFGASTIIQSLQNNFQIPEQKITRTKIKLKKPIIASILSAPLCSFLPGLGSGQAAVIGSMISKTNTKNFLTLLGITNTLVMGFSILTLFTIQKTRTGTALFIKEIIPNLETKYLILILIIIIFSSIISFYLTLWLGKIISLNISKLNYKILAYITLGILITTITLVSGFSGLGIFIISTLTGLYSLRFRIRRTNMMGCLIVPSIIWGLF